MNPETNLPQNDLPADADPMIDALMAEFISEDPRRHALPPDLSDEILSALARLETTASQHSVSGQPASQRTPRSNAPGETAESNSALRMISIAVALAASVLAGAWLVNSGNRPSLKGGSELAGRAEPDLGINSNSPVNNLASEDSAAGHPEKMPPNPDEPTSPGPNAPSSRPLGKSGKGALAESDTSTQPRSRKPLQGIRLDQPERMSDHGLVSDNVPNGNDATDSGRQELLPIASVASQLAKHAEDYWGRLGIEPTPDATNAEVAARTQKRLNVGIQAQWLDDAETLRERFSQRRLAQSIAAQWLVDTTGASPQLVGQEENSELVDHLGQAIASTDKSFGTAFVSLVDGSSSHSDRWFNLVSQGRSGNHRISGMAGHLAQLTMNADLRCVRCHDDMIGRSGTQDDHWGFVALIRQAVRREANQWKVGRPDGIHPTFFELSDGRQRLAAPQVGSSLMQQTEVFDDFQTWTKSLTQSDEFARSIVDSLWALVHGRRLSPAVFDAFAPPADEALDRIRDELAKDLITSDYDVSRTLALIVTSPMNRRSIPEPLLPENSLVASDIDRSNALDRVAAFAAAVERPSSKRSQRIDLALKRVGGKLRLGAGDSLLAQPMLESPKESLSRDRGMTTQQAFIQQLSVDFPGDDATLPVSWLRSIEGYDQQVQHLVYLAGGHDVPSNIAETAQRFRQAGTPESALARLWWVLKN